MSGDRIGRRDGRLPITIVSGFLGAGKSTWLRHQIHERRFGRACVLVNEAAEAPVDHLLLSNARRLQVLAGGCACCEGSEALRIALVELCGGLDRGDDADGIDRVVLETSGVADPGAIAAAIAADPVLSRRMTVEGTIVLVDASSGGEQIITEPLARSQLEAADEIVVTKAMTASRSLRSTTAATLRLISPVAELSWTELGCKVGEDTDPTAEPFAAPLDGIKLAPIRPHRLDAEGATWVAMSAWLSALLVARGRDVMRVKGAVRTPAGRLLLQSVRDHVQPAEILPEIGSSAGDEAHEEDFLVLIGRDIEPHRLKQSWDRFVIGVGSESETSAAASI